MKNLLPARVWSPLFGLFFVAGIAQATVIATPAFYDFGSVSPGQSSSTMIQFMNLSPEPVNYFNVLCSGDLSVFSCSSNCGQLAPYGSCLVSVVFMPRNGDDLTRALFISGQGDGVWASANVQGRD